MLNSRPGTPLSRPSTVAGAVTAAAAQSPSAVSGMMELLAATAGERMKGRGKKKKTTTPVSLPKNRSTVGGRAAKRTASESFLGDATGVGPGSGGEGGGGGAPGAAERRPKKTIRLASTVNSAAEADQVSEAMAQQTYGYQGRPPKPGPELLGNPALRWMMSQQQAQQQSVQHPGASP